MSTTAETLRLVLAMRLALSDLVDQATRDMSRQWAVAWQEIADEFRDAVDELIDMIDDGRWPTRTKVLRAQHAANAIKAAVDAMQDLGQQAGVRVVGDLDGILDLAEHWSQRIVGTQLPDDFDLAWSRVDRRELDAIVRRTTDQIHAGTRPLSKITEQRMKAVLIRGVAVGDHPDRAARQILARCQGVFNGGLYRASNIARTEMLDASRQAALASRRENRTVLAGWRWHCDLSSNTCPSCLARNGELHDSTELGPLDHQQGRCTAVPVTKSWRDLGINLDEPADDFPDARQWFTDQPADVQAKIMGRDRLAAFNRGEIGWDDMSQLRRTNGWRDSYGVAPLPAR